jgi:hypothetical protein
VQTEIDLFHTDFNVMYIKTPNTSKSIFAALFIATADCIYRDPPYITLPNLNYSIVIILLIVTSSIQGCLVAR